MCGIYGSFNKKRYDVLGELNESRGVKESTNNELIIGDDTYFIGHVQSPTSNSAKPHPAVSISHYGEYRLWHNGIVKDVTLNKYRKLVSYDFKDWDTMFILKMIYNTGFGGLSKIDGSFACVYNDNKNDTFIFRNELAPLYIDCDLNLSSIKYDDMQLLPPNKVFYINDNKELVVVAEFETLNNPYKL